jgi:hypothetical protein
MKKLTIFLLMMILPMTALANEIANEAEKPLLSVEWYADDIKQFRTGLKKDIDESSDSYYIINALQAQLDANWKQSLGQEVREQADYRVAFMSIPFRYRDKPYISGSIELKSFIPYINPPLPNNKHADEVGVTPYNFTSPWMRGVLYIRDGKPVGGTILLPISPLARIDELYHAEHEEWKEFVDRDSTKLDEMSIPTSVYGSTLGLCQTAVFNMRELDTRKKMMEETNKIFATKSKAELTVARLIAISNSIDRMIRVNYYKCLKNSEGFYKRLYEHLFTQLFTKTTYPTSNDKTIHNIVPSAEALQSLHDASGNYNCFSPDFKETAQ